MSIVYQILSDSIFWKIYGKQDTSIVLNISIHFNNQYNIYSLFIHE